MGHLQSNATLSTTAAATTFARALMLSSYTTDAEGMRRLNRLAKVMEVNPHIVNPKLTPAERAPYFEVLYNHVDAFALGLEDLREPALVQPFEIHTFGAPAYR